MNASTRRSAITVSLTGCALAQCQPWARAGDEGDAEAVSATEDLMREHGVLNRLMLVYEAALSPPASTVESIHEVLHRAASLIRSFIEDYHGVLEEKFVFPEFERQREHAALVTTLRDQHRVGRALTGVVLAHATEAGLANAITRADLTRACHDFIRMFRAHEAREDTELFPAFRRLVPVSRLRELGEQFEDIEHRTFGKDGYAEVVRQVAQLEHHAGIDHLDTFTAQAPTSRNTATRRP